jgi:hypothetical protein
MTFHRSIRRRLSLALSAAAIAAAFAAVLAPVGASDDAAPGALADGSLIQVSDDPFTNPTSQHRTEVEPDTFAFGSTWVSAFQAGRFFDLGASGIGFATARDQGVASSRASCPG